MSAISGFALACSVFQTISFAHEAIQVCQDIYRGRSPEGHLKDTAETLGSLAAELRHHHQAFSPHARDESQKRLCDVAEKCQRACRGLQEELVWILGKQHASGKLIATLREFFRASWRKGRLTRLEKSVDDYQKLMDTLLIGCICNQTKAIQIRQSQEFASQRESLQRMIDSIADGHTSNATISDAIRASSVPINEHTTQQVLGVETRLNSHIIDAVKNAERDTRAHIDLVIRQAAERFDHEQSATSGDVQAGAMNDDMRRYLLERLEFPRMRERKSMVASFNESFSWIFEEHERLRGNNSATSQGDSKDGYSDENVTSNSENYEKETGDGAILSNRPNSPYIDQCQDDSSSTSSQHDDIYDSSEWECLKEFYVRGKSSEKSWDSFLDWLRSENKIYWVNGKAGSGKSTLMKFLEGHSQTEAALGAWSPVSKAVIISHFFWKPGSELQKNIRGLHLSLLYQLIAGLSIDPRTFLPDTVRGWFYTNSSHGDWSDEHLAEAFHSLVKAYPTHICIFVDGLDEVSGKDTVPDIVDWLHRTRRVFPNVKICVASRPEPLLETELGSFHNLRLQNLTAPDIFQYICKALRTSWKRSHVSEQMRPVLVEKVLCRADGIFLWVHLALQSIKTGLGNRDNFEELIQRLDELPAELSDLYWDMWNRMNGNTNIHKVLSARYFNMMLAAHPLSDRWYTYTGLFESSGNPGEINLTLLQVVAVTDEGFRESLLDVHLSGPVNLNCVDWQRVLDTIRAKGAGLIDIYPNERPVSAVEAVTGAEDSTHGSSLMMSTLHFAHRTAYDFLTDTEHGREILSYDTWSAGDHILHLFQGVLSSYLVIPPVEPGNTPSFRLIVYFVTWSIRALVSVIEPALAFEVTKVLHKSWEIFDRIYAQMTEEPAAHPGYFLSTVAFPEPLFLVWVVSQIQSLSSDETTSALAAEAATMVLRNMHHVSLVDELLDCCKYLKGWSCSFVEKLLQYGADLNCQGAYIWDALRPKPGEFVSHISPYGSFLKGVCLCHEYDIDYASGCLAVFDNAKLDNWQRVALQICTDHDESGRLASVTLGSTNMSGFSAVWHPRRSLHFYVDYFLEVDLHFLNQLARCRTLGTLSGFDVHGASAQNIIANLDGRSHCEVALLRISLQDYTISDVRLSNGKVSQEIAQVFWPWLSARDRNDIAKSPEWSAKVCALRGRLQQGLHDGLIAHQTIEGPTLKYLADRHCDFMYASDVDLGKD